MRKGGSPLRLKRDFAHGWRGIASRFFVYRKSSADAAAFPSLDCRRTLLYNVHDRSLGPEKVKCKKEGKYYGI